jgi:hypothetical protein
LRDLARDLWLRDLARDLKFEAHRSLSDSLVEGSSSTASESGVVSFVESIEATATDSLTQEVVRDADY